MLGASIETRIMGIEKKSLVVFICDPVDFLTGCNDYNKVSALVCDFYLLQGKWG